MRPRTWSSAKAHPSGALGRGAWHPRTSPMRARSAPPRVRGCEDAAPVVAPARCSAIGSTTSSSPIAAGSMSGSCPTSAGEAKTSRRLPRICETRSGVRTACRASIAAGYAVPAAPQRASTALQRPDAISVVTRLWMSPGATRHLAATTRSSLAATIPPPLHEVRAHENGPVESHYGHFATALD